jgi:DNA-binding PadR family transcriptional regulator
VTRSQVYRELAHLADRGLIEPGSAGPRDRQPYRLTAAGRAAFGAWLATDPEPDHLRIPLLLRLTFADGLEPERIREMLTAHRDLHAERLRRYEELERDLAKGDAPGQVRATLAYGIGHERAVLDWLTQLAPQLLGLD